MAFLPQRVRGGIWALSINPFMHPKMSSCCVSFFLKGKP